MSKGAIKLSLGPLQSRATTRLSIVVPSTLKENLERYAALHTQIYGEPISVEALIPHMLEAFVRRDRGFKKPVELTVKTAARQDATRGMKQRAGDEPDARSDAQQS